MIATPRYLRRFEASELPQVFTEVLVIGSGVAGHSAALAAANAGARVTLTTKSDLLESNTLYAQAGIAAPLGPDDAAERHVADTLRAGDGLCNRAVVELVVSEAVEAVKSLAAVGVAFDCQGDDSGFSLGREGGHSVRRVAHARGDSTGREFQRALSDAARAHPGIRTVESAFAIDLLTDDGRCVGALFEYSGELRVIWSHVLILASGGAGRLFRESTNPAVTTGDGLAMAYRAGAKLRDMEFMQFHPTVLYVPGAERALLSEAARGEGALILDVRGERFLDAFDERAELAPRDVVSRAIVTHMLRHGDTHVLLDLRGLDPERLNARLPGVVATGRSIGIDVTRRPLPVRPAAHYTIGGVITDEHGRTSIPGMFAAGEVSSSGLHGANRLASNSLLEGAVFGRRAGAAAAREAAGARVMARRLSGAPPGPAASSLDAGDLVRSIESVLWREASVRREGPGLTAAARLLEDWGPLVLGRQMPDADGVEAQNLCILAYLLVEAAIAREETRGVHWRTDHPDRDDEHFAGHLVQETGLPAAFVPLHGESAG